MRLLEHSSVDVRISAGENIALLLEGLDDDVRLYNAFYRYVNFNESHCRKKTALYMNAWTTSWKA
jgi:hypothetical protein